MTADVPAPTPALEAALAERVGEGAVMLNGQLTPVECQRLSAAAGLRGERGAAAQVNIRSVEGRLRPQASGRPGDAGARPAGGGATDDQLGLTPILQGATPGPPHRPSHHLTGATAVEPRTTNSG